MPLYTFFSLVDFNLCNYTLCIEQQCFRWRLGTDVCCKYFSFCFFFCLFLLFVYVILHCVMRYSERRRPYTGYINASWFPTPEAAA
ncbi:hypothetical protein BDV30DRAFT_30310 [Aspergillus minisclerotigenes]|uniref:Uncharacterized protein n=1 Tax=Aspergillus minisclerotigenes TaxID=656917 RepID=A0A5N6IRB5_9EURO|nr:hypothetical protein BDV30DRAFT_30310 [Aspergillus minisclerotigenes]